MSIHYGSTSVPSWARVRRGKNLPCVWNSPCPKTPRRCSFRFPFSVLSWTVEQYVYIQVAENGWQKPYTSPYCWTGLSTAALCRSLVGRSKRGRTYRVRGSSLPNDPTMGFFPLPRPVFLFFLCFKVPLPITCPITEY